MSARELRCHHCRDLIGVYEPFVVVRDGLPVRTSTAAAGGAPPDSERCFHSECFEMRGDEEEPRDR